MAIDRGDYHYEDAGSWEKACRHIALFLWWCFERGLATSDENEIDPVEMAKNPTQTFIESCDTKLWEADLKPEGQEFAKSAYDDYLCALHDYAEKLEIGDYEVPESEETTRFFFDWLDKRLAEFRV
jgi:hypothetical protein